MVTAEEASSHQKLEEARDKKKKKKGQKKKKQGTGSSLKHLEWEWSCQYLDFSPVKQILDTWPPEV